MPNLAARCTSCGTVFRVVQDQLRVAGGLVRCGRCGEVFNAAEALIDLDTATASTFAALPAEEAVRAEAVPSVASEHEHEHERERAHEPEPELEPARGLAFDLHLEAERAAAPALDFAAVEPLHQTTALAEPLHAVPPADSSIGAASAYGPEADAAQPPDPRAEPNDMPSFVRSADRAQRWRQPRVRAALSAVVVLGAVGLAAQAAVSWRDTLAARVPATRPALEAACDALGCRVEAARSIDKLAVESSGLVRVEKSSVYKLQVTLRNRGDITLALPALDLTLSDGAGKTVARRVLRMADLGVNTATLAAGRDLALQATLQAATDPVIGYTIELFYP